MRICVGMFLGIYECKVNMHVHVLLWSIKLFIQANRYGFA